MQLFALIANVLAVVAAASDTSRKPGQEVKQLRLRGSASRAGKQVQSAITVDFFGVDDKSCLSEGMTPGVCVLASLARSATPGTPLLQKKAAAPDARDGGLAVHGVTREQLERALIAEIESALAGNHTGFNVSQLQSLEQELLPIFAALPHEQHATNSSEARIGYAAARHLLHQHFLRQHSWHVRGLSPARAVSPDAQSLRSRVAGHLLKVVEGKVGKQGFGLKMLAVFAATLKHLFQGDEQESLKHVWSLYGLQGGNIADGLKVRDVLEAFLAHHIYSYDGVNAEGKQDQGFVPSVQVAREEILELQNVYTGWPRLSLFIQREVERALAPQKRLGKKLSFQDVWAIADRLLEYFQEVSGSMCNDIERKIGEFVGGEKGRVNLAVVRENLWSNGSRLVDEPEYYIRELGALEGDYSDPYLVVPNWLQGPSNCDMSTSFYDLCCPNNCEKHKAHLEREFLSAKSDNSSASVVAVITKTLQHRLGSELPADMLKSLDIIASSHGGAIQIHSKAFADWLHKVFPRDCPRTRSVDWTGETGDLLPAPNDEFTRPNAPSSNVVV